MTDYDRFRFRKESKGLLSFFGSDNKKSQQLKNYLIDYPAYNITNPWMNTQLSDQQAQENFLFFQAQKEQRLNYITQLLREFSLDIDFNNPTRHDLLSLDAWAYQQWPAITNEDFFVTGVYRFDFDGFDVLIRSFLFDLSVFLGECYLTIDEKADWFFDIGENSRKQDRASLNRLVIKLPPSPNQPSDWDFVIDIEDHVFHHYRSQKKSNAILSMKQKIGEVLSQPILEKMKNL